MTQPQFGLPPFTSQQPMPQFSSQSSYYVQPDHRGMNKGRSFGTGGRRSGGGFSGNFQKEGCQIFGKNNHTAFSVVKSVRSLVRDVICIYGWILSRVISIEQ